MKKFFSTLSLLLLSTVAAQAAVFQTVAVDKSQITFSFKQMGVNMDGKFKRFHAQIQWDTTQLHQAKGGIEIDLNSIDTGSNEADQEVLSKSWFHVAAYPKATFVLKSLQPLQGQSYEAKGLLTLKGQTREVVAPAALTPQGMLTGSFVLKRADYAIGEGMWAKFDVVANEILVKFNLALQ
jgi:polyisoprenoid-binding protein YceI